MQLIIKTTPKELQKAKSWWEKLEMQWKMAFNEAVFGKGPTVEPPKDEELMILLVRADTLRFAGPTAYHPNMTITVDNLSGLVPLYHLTYLSITNMNFTSLEELRNHTNLEHLFVYENKLTSLKGIEKMKKLINLYCQGNKIEDLSPIKNLTQLETIYASNNTLSKVEGLTEAHADHLKQFFILPNENLRDKEVLRVQNTLGIICRKG